MTMFIVIVLVALAMIGFGWGTHLQTMNQYRKKQKADRKLYCKVLDHLHQRLTLSQARHKYNLQFHFSLLTSIQEKTKFPLTQNDRVIPLLNGEEKFAVLFEELRQAKHHIHLLYYTIRDDQIGKKLQDILLEKAKQGVEVRVLVDGVGSKDFPSSTTAILKEAGIQWAVFAPPKLHHLLQFNFRNHRKIAVIDGRVALTGGLNIGDEYVHRDPQKGFWRDTHVLTEGESVLLMQRIFATDWYYVTHEQLTEDDQFFPSFSKEGTHTQEGTQRKQQSILAQVVPTGPDMDHQFKKNIYRDMILSARQRVWISTPYFVPDNAVMAAIKKVKKRGVDVRIIVPAQTDNPLVQHASYYYYQSLIPFGVRVYQYKKGFYHAKTALVDHDICQIGSTNIDRRSFNYSFEAGVLIYDRCLAQQMEQTFLEDIEESEALLLEQVAGRSVFQQTATYLSLLIAPWL